MAETWKPAGFDDQTVLVTGSSQGIGLAIARAFLESGARVILSSRAPVDPSDILDRELSRRAIHVRADLSTPAEIERLFAIVDERVGRLDVLVNNAAVQSYETVGTASAEAWEHTLKLNVVAASLCIREAVKRMNNGGCIVNISSTVSHRPGRAASYAASKAALAAITRSAAIEFGPAIRVNSVSPGLIERPDLRTNWPEGVAAYENNAPLKSIGQPHDVANACLFLCSPLARWITGADLVVDGGMTIAK